MAGRIKVADPGGEQWTVKRRWFTWRRRVTIGDAFGAVVDADTDDSVIGFLLFIPLLLLAAVALAFSLVDLVAQLVVLPFTVLARLIRLASWPVDARRAGKHERTLKVKGFRAAGELRDRTAEKIDGGSLPNMEVAAGTTSETPQ